MVPSRAEPLAAPGGIESSIAPRGTESSAAPYGSDSSAAPRGAVVSTDRRYRYRLWRRWDEGSVVCWVLLNPSTAAASTDDPTTRRVAALSRSWGFGGCEVVNLFAVRTSSPSGLRTVADPVGPDNLAAIGAAFDTARAGGIVVAGWGAWRASGVPVVEAADAVVAEIGRRGLRVVAIARNTDGSPRHPLYVRRDATYSDLE